MDDKTYLRLYLQREFGVCSLTDEQLEDIIKNNVTLLGKIESACNMMLVAGHKRSDHWT